MKHLSLFTLYAAMNISIIFARSPRHCISFERQLPYSFSMFSDDTLRHDSTAKRMAIPGPAMNVIIEYLGGDTLLVYVENLDGERIWLRLLQDGTTLLVDKLKPLKAQQRIYLISQFPAGVYTIRIKKGNYSIEKDITKRKRSGE